MKELLRKKLLYLRESHSFVGIKGGTEVEDMTFEELNLLREISKDILPMVVKIGGPEARNDIRFSLNIGVDGILAPMIESEYGMINFVDTIKELAGLQTHNLFLALNIETITGYLNINSIINHTSFQFIKQVTVGRSDLAASMEHPVNHTAVMNVTSDIVKRVKEANRMTSVGGKIDPISAQQVKNAIQPNKINTRHISIDLNKSKNLIFSICEALAFEIELYKLFMNIDPNKKESYQNRIEDTKLRMEKRELILPLFQT